MDERVAFLPLKIEFINFTTTTLVRIIVLLNWTIEGLTSELYARP